MTAPIRLACRFSAILAFCLLLSNTLLAAPAKNARPAFRIVGYLPDYRLAALDEARLSCVTDLVIFSAEPTSAGSLNNSRLTPAFLTRLSRLKRPGQRLWVTVGGWERSAGFAPMAANAAKRHLFVLALTQFCLSHHFDGADFDWEHPANAAEETDYGMLLAETRQAFAPRHLDLSVTIAAWQKLTASAIAAVDFVNLMSYDHADRHSTLAQAKIDVAGLVQQHIPPGKICLGIPFYGRGITQPNTTETYADIQTQYHPAPAADEVNGLYFNGYDTVQQKTRFALAHGLGGVMVWEIDQDAPGKNSLLKAIHQAVTTAP